MKTLKGVFICSILLTSWPLPCLRGEIDLLNAAGSAGLFFFFLQEFFLKNFVLNVFFICISGAITDKSRGGDVVTALPCIHWLHDLVK